MMANDKKIASDSVLNTGDVEAKILEKIKFQCKTLRKAFIDLNVEKTGKISKKEFRFYLNFWGMNISQEVFDQIFSKFDLDGDGLISYKDFQVSIGSEMFPAEGLYFRQDKQQICKQINCKHEECWQPTQNGQNFCVLHQKMHQDVAISVFTKIFKKVDKRWKEFIKELKATSMEDD